MASSPPQSGAQSDYPDHIDAAVLKVAGVVVLGAIMGPILGGSYEEGQWRDGAFHDGVLYSVLRSEWCASRV